MITVSTADGTTTVHFQIPIECGAERAAVVGEFNDWSEDATPMTLGDDGFTATLDLATDRTYRFRYLLDGVRWENDWAAHAYVPNDYGGSDSVVDLSALTPREESGPSESLVDLSADGDVSPVPAVEPAAEPSSTRRRTRRAKSTPA